MVITDQDPYKISHHQRQNKGQAAMRKYFAQNGSDRDIPKAQSCIPRLGVKIRCERIVRFRTYKA